MSQINFSINASRQAGCRAPYNPRGRVGFRSTSLAWRVVPVVAVMALVFAIVWFV